MTFEELLELIRSHIHFSGHTWIAVEDLARAILRSPEVLRNPAADSPEHTSD
jgi:hypothetical protein